jgi:tripartite-type tricarboxylate transporter receptor subunit TctC
MWQRQAVRFHFLLRSFLWYAGILAGNSSIYAQEYPIRPIRVVVPQAAGSSTDIVARIFAEQVGARLKQQIIVEPRPGAGGSIGATVVAKAPADGYTLLMANSGPLAINAGLYPHLPYDPVRDFSPVSLTAVGPYVLLTHPSLPASSVQQLIALSKARPGELTFASGGNGTGTHLSGELLKQSTGANLVHVPYKGTGPGLVDLIAGQVSVLFAGVPPALPHVINRRARPLAVTGSKRTSVMPDVPTMMEAGVAGYEVHLWLGLVGPAGTPSSVTQKLNSQLRESWQSPQIRDRMTALGLDAVVTTPADFASYIKSEIQRWRAVIDGAGIRLQ